MSSCALLVPGLVLLGLMSGCSSSDPPSEGAGGALSSAGSAARGADSSAGNASAGAGVPQSSAGSTSAGAAGATASGDPEPASQMGMTAAHNAARGRVMPAASPEIPPLMWSATIATTAQSWAERCVFEHSGGKYGENIYASAGKDASASDVVASWASEAKDYDYATNSCSGTCGHYTQVVARRSVSLGCGVAKCTKNSPFSGFSDWQYWVCNYDPPGNFNNEKPY